MGAGEGMAKGGGGGGGAGGVGGDPLMGGAGLGVGLGLAQMLVRDARGGETLAPAAAGVTCGSCGAGVPPGKFCNACGEQLKEKSSASAFCTACGQPVTPDARFCGQCGQKQ